MAYDPTKCPCGYKGALVDHTIKREKKLTLKEAIAKARGSDSAPQQERRFA